MPKQAEVVSIKGTTKFDAIVIRYSLDTAAIALFQILQSRFELTFLVNKR